ncbi:hypothetical protein MTR_4g132060 [Medicago truncatula]|uniref:Uncharacterized protein n=1 Tax=Medicago truncatula TaxID=3880 RepID=G7JJ66_MEDTR|nr:hypothetical protein MTR_4g132060 [Medicago truncatula]
MSVACFRGKVFSVKIRLTDYPHNPIPTFQYVNISNFNINIIDVSQGLKATIYPDNVEILTYLASIYYDLVRCFYQFVQSRKQLSCFQNEKEPSKGINLNEILSNGIEYIEILPKGIE